jgi:hypothetical protein
VDDGETRPSRPLDVVERIEVDSPVEAVWELLTAELDTSSTRVVAGSEEAGGVERSYELLAFVRERRLHMRSAAGPSYLEVAWSLERLGESTAVSMGMAYGSQRLLSRMALGVLRPLVNRRMRGQILDSLDELKRTLEDGDGAAEPS